VDQALVGLVVALGLVGAVVGGLAYAYRAGAALATERDRAHRAELDGRDASIASLRAELAAVRAQAADGRAAAAGLVAASGRIAGAPSGAAGDWLLWDGDAARPGGSPPDAPGPAA